MNFDKQYIITRYLFSLLTLQQYRTLRSKMENSKKILRAQAPQMEKPRNEEPQKNEKTHEKITLPTFEKEAKRPNCGGSDSHST